MRFATIFVIGVLVTLIYLPLRIGFIILMSIKTTAMLLYYMPEIATMLEQQKSKEDVQKFCEKVGIL
jgi:hypothetical protein